MKRWYWLRDWWELERPSLVCRIVGHPKERRVWKMSGEILCPRCRTEVGRWGV